MPATHVALFRGINVGTANRVSMAELAAALSGLGCTGVRTLLNSGNAVFTAPRAWRGDPGVRIAAAVLARTGVQSRVTVLTADELRAIARRNPLARDGRAHSRLLVSILAEASDHAAMAALARRAWGADEVALGPRAVYVWCETGLLDSAPAKEIARLLKDRVTSRNWATIQKLAAICPAEGVV
jgi:uncharacterized protein (DUF1697 family)